MIACPKCGAGSSRVVKTKPNPEGQWRRRVCKKCGGKFSTTETVKTKPGSA
ncbi:NrdR family transcriptional regulator [Methylohalobius crimeensis]|uniref:NrdR family transcriptional regulator n=1 Tax=Methylohalobius crimeensis TaxID=244365 RepID=UPI0038995857